MPYNYDPDELFTAVTQALQPSLVVSRFCMMTRMTIRNRAAAAVQSFPGRVLQRERANSSAPVVTTDSFISCAMDQEAEVSNAGHWESMQEISEMRKGARIQH